MPQARALSLLTFHVSRADLGAPDETSTRISAIMCGAAVRSGRDIVREWVGDAAGFELVRYTTLRSPRLWIRGCSAATPARYAVWWLVCTALCALVPIATERATEHDTERLAASAPRCINACRAEVSDARAQVCSETLVARAARQVVPGWCRGGGGRYARASNSSSTNEPHSSTRGAPLRTARRGW